MSVAVNYINRYIYALKRFSRYLEYEEILDYVFNRFGADTAFKVDQYLSPQKAHAKRDEV